jgi:hypothetical protein
VCPWGDDLLVVDDIVPSFRKILQQYFYMVYEILPLQDIALLKDRAAKFDESLHTLLRFVNSIRLFALILSPWFDKLYKI